LLLTSSFNGQVKKVNGGADFKVLKFTAWKLFWHDISNYITCLSYNLTTCMVNFLPNCDFCPQIAFHFLARWRLLSTLWSTAIARRSSKIAAYGSEIGLFGYSHQPKGVKS